MTVSLAALSADPVAAIPAMPNLLRPGTLALFLAPALRSAGLRGTAADSRITRGGIEVPLGEVFATCQQVLATTLGDLPPAPRAVFEESIARDAATLAFWRAHPHGAERTDRYIRRLARLRERLAAELPDPLDIPVRFPLLAAALHLDDVTGFGAYFLADLADALAALGD